jgi:drug/metabolite transporter (DMT)-like permease
MMGRLAARVARTELRQPRILLALVCAVAGVALLVGLDPTVARRGGMWTGVGLALVSALSYVLFQVCGRIVASRYHPCRRFRCSSSSPCSGCCRSPWSRASSLPILR